MAFSLGVDVGTTFTAAAIWQDDRVEVVALEAHRVTVPTVIYADGEDVRFGGAAVPRAATHPHAVAREFKRRMGDSVPIILSGSPYSADRLVALFVRWVVDSVASQYGERPERVAITHPANWTDFQRNLVTTALGQVGIGEFEMLSEPEAAAHDFAASARLDPGDLVLVYDLGGGTFDVVLLRHEDTGFSHVGEAAGVERLGGIDFDEAVVQYVLDQVPAPVLEAARDDPAGRMALAQLRLRCVEAKEALSSDVSVDVPVVLPNLSSTVRLTRPEFEEMIRPMLRQTIELSRQVLDQADLEIDALSAILIVGGSSRIPLVSELVTFELGAPVRVDAHPKLVVARGAALWAGSRPESAHREPRRRTPATPDEPRRRSRLWLLAPAIAVLLLAGGWWLTRSGESDGETAPEVFPTAGEPIPENVVVFTRLRSDGIRQLWSLDLDRPTEDSQRVQRLATGLGSTWDNLPAISPDRRHIAYTTEQAGRFVLAVAAWDGGERLLLLDGDPVTVANDARATWSSDGTKLAYVANRGGTDDLFVYDATTQSERQLTNDDFSEADPAWSPSTDEILYTVESGETGLDIMIIPAAGGSAERLTSEPGDESDPSWSPDGNEIAFAGRQPADGSPSELFAMDRDGTGIRRLIDAAFDTGSTLKDDADPSWSPDGSQIAFESTRDEGIWVVDAAGQRDPEPVADDDTWIFVHPAWR